MIDRYELRRSWAAPALGREFEGRWVEYPDHITALQQQRKQVIAEVEEALTSDEARQIVVDAMFVKPISHVREEDATAACKALAAALATLTKGGTDV